MKKEIKEKVILDLCGGTGAWSKPYKDAGYDVRNITLPEYDVIEYAKSFPDFVPDDESGKYIYGILAAPPCTQFSLAAGKKFKDRNAEGGLKIVDACLKIIWKCKPEFWAIENPVGYLRRFLGKPTFTFRQWEFGDKGIKPTDLWGFFNLPTKKVKIRLLYISAGGSSGRKPRKNLGKVSIRITIEKVGNEWAILRFVFIGKTLRLEIDKQIQAKTEAEARAKMLIYLIENNLLEIKK